MAKSKFKYKPFEQAVDEVKGDFENYNLQNKIKNHQLIKVAKRVNYDLGLRIYKTKNVVLQVENGRAKLPDDLFSINYLYGLGRHEMVTAMPQGTHVEEVPLDAPDYHPGVSSIDVCATPEPCPEPDPICPDPCDPCETTTPTCSTWFNCQGQEMQLIQKIKYQTRKWTEFYKIRLVGDDQYYDSLCLNKTWQARHTGFVRESGGEAWMFFSFKEGEVYLNYQGMMEDDEGCLLVLSHDEIDHYYEYEMKERVLEILMGNNEQVNMNFMKLIMEKKREARIRAKSIVNTPNFRELKETWARTRKAMWNRYYKLMA